MNNKLFKDNNLYRFGPFRLNAGERRLTRGGDTIPLQAKALELLRILVAEAGHLKTREELIASLWSNTVVEEQGLTLRLHALRRALGDDRGTPAYIETVHGAGYRFIAPVTVEGTKPATSTQSALPVIKRPGRRLWIASGGALLAAIVVVAVLAGTGITFQDSRKASIATPSIAVLPFENLSNDKNNAYFVAGIQDEILTSLAKIGGLKVISRTSTEHYKSHPRDLRNIARQLGVVTVLEGSVQKADNKVHINVQLINAYTQDHIWAHSYNRTLTNVFGVEGEVAEKIANALSARLLPRERVRIARVPTRDPHAYDLFLKATYYANRIFNRGNVKNPASSAREAVTLYRQATVRDPRFALAWARLSLLESWAWWYRVDTGDSRIAVAEKAAKRALALDPALPEAHLAMGYSEYYGQKDYTAALAQFERARANLPNGAGVIAAIAFVHRRQGKWQQALTELRRVAELDPRNPRRHYEIGVTLAELRRYAEAERQFDRALAIEPYDYDAMAYKIRLLFLAGETVRARQELATIPSGIDPQGVFSALRFESAWLARKPGRALAALVATPAWVLSATAQYDVPVGLLRGRAWLMKGDEEQAGRAYEAARAKLHTALESQPDGPILLGALGMTEAGLGNKQEAIRAGVRARQLVPVAKDAFYGTTHLAVLAIIYAQTRETERAVKLLQRLLAMPAGGAISVPLLRLDPIWDPIRNDPRFKALLLQYDKKRTLRSAPASHSSFMTKHLLVGSSPNRAGRIYDLTPLSWH